MSRRSAIPSGRERRRNPLLLRKLGGAAGREDLEMRALGVLDAFDQGGGGHVAKDEMTIAVAPFQMGRTDLGVDHQRRADRARADHVGGGLNAEGGRGAGHVHVKGKSFDP